MIILGAAEEEVILVSRYLAIGMLSGELKRYFPTVFKIRFSGSESTVTSFASEEEEEEG